MFQTYGGPRLIQNTFDSNYNTSSRANQNAENSKIFSGQIEQKDKGNFDDVMSLLDTSFSS